MAELFVDAGELNQQVTIFSEAAAPNANGYDTVTLTPIRTCYAKVTQVSGTELIKAGADMGAVKLRVLIRWSGSIPVDRKMLLQWRGKQYGIEYLNDYGGSGQFMELICTRQTTEGAV